MTSLNAQRKKAVNETSPITLEVKVICWGRVNKKYRFFYYLFIYLTSVMSIITKRKEMQWKETSLMNEFWEVLHK